MRLPFVPMEPKPCPAPFDSPEHLFQVKWDGVRCLALVEAGKVRLWSRRLRERTGQYPELAALAAQVRAARAVLDGELIALSGGKPSFFRILEREMAGAPGAAQRLAGRVPATFMVFDLLELGGRELYSLPLSRRQQLLHEAVQPGGAVQVVESFPAIGRRVFQAVQAQDLEGIVAKKADSPYVPGARLSHWLKVKVRRRMLCAVGGYTHVEGHVRALLVGAYAGSRLRYLGRVGSGLTHGHERMIKEHLAPSAACPFDPLPRLAGSLWARAVSPSQVTWVQVRLTVWVDYMEVTEDGRLRAPVIAGFSDQPPAAAVLHQV